MRSGTEDTDTTKLNNSWGETHGDARAESRRQALTGINSTDADTLILDIRPPQS